MVIKEKQYSRLPLFAHKTQFKNSFADIVGVRFAQLRPKSFQELHFVKESVLSIGMQ